MKNLMLSLFALLLTIGLIGCSSNEVNQQSTDQSNEKESTNNSDDEVLGLGETGRVQTTIGDYEITFESFQLLDELEGETADKNEVFILMDAKVTNVGEETLNGQDLYTASIYSDDGLSAENTFYYESINLLKGTIESGESMEGEFVFSSSISDNYKLVYNHALGEELTWKFSADEASN